MFKKLKKLFKRVDKPKNMCYNKGTRKQKNKKTKGSDFMKNYQDLQEMVRETKYTVKNDKIKQTERNTLKEQAVTSLLADLPNAVGRTREGIVVEFDNEEEGAIYGVVDIKFKNLDYDPNHDIDVFSETIEKRIVRENERQKKREEGTE